MFKTRIRWERIADSAESLLSCMPENGVKGIYVGGKNVCLVSHQGKLHALRDRCPHQGYVFSKGACAHDGTLVCPWHRYGFSLQTGRGAGLHVDVYPLEERPDGLYIGFEYLAFGF